MAIPPTTRAASPTPLAHWHSLLQYHDAAADPMASKLDLEASSAGDPFVKSSSNSGATGGASKSGQLASSRTLVYLH